jgi:hypothetical protein
MRSPHIIPPPHPKLGSHLTTAAVLLLCAFVLPVSPADRPSTTAQNPQEPRSAVEQFKEFLSHPPPLQEIVFKRKILGDIEARRPPDGSFARSTNFAFYAAQYLPDSTIVRFQRTPVRLDSPELSGDLYSIANGQHWLVEERKRQAQFWVQPSSGSSAQSNTLPHTIQFRSRHFFQCLNFGVSHALPATLRWKGNRFEILLDKQSVTPIEIRGELQVDPIHNRANGMRITYQTETSSVDYLIRYHYEQPLSLPYLPNRFQTYLARNGSELEYEDFTILDLKQRDSLISAPSLDIRSLVFSNGYRLFARTNGALYEVEPLGGMRFIQEIGKEGALDADGSRRTKLFQIYAGFGVANFGIFILAARMKRKQTPR